MTVTLLSMNHVYSLTWKPLIQSLARIITEVQRWKLHNHYNIKMAKFCSLNGGGVWDSSILLTAITCRAHASELLHKSGFASVRSIWNISDKETFENTVLPPGFKREPYLVVLLKSEVLFSSTGARNFKKFGTEEEEWSFFLKAVR